MRDLHRRAALVALVCVALLSGGAAVTANASQQGSGSYVVAYGSAGIPAALRARVEALGGEISQEWAGIGYCQVRGVSAADAASLADVGGVRGVAADSVVSWIAPVTSAVVHSEQLPEVTAHDPSNAFFFNAFQWNMRQIDADDAWAAGHDAAGILVAVLDTGVNTTHPDMAGVVDTSLSRTFVTSSPVAADLTSFDDFNFHGTHVAGIITTNGFGTAGVAPHATIVAVKVLNVLGSGSFGDVISGILYASSIPVDVINMSLGAEIPDTSDNSPLFDALRDAVRAAREAGVYVVVSAGNSALDLDNRSGHGPLVAVPAQSDRHVAAVSATGPINQANFDALASYSNFGSGAISVAAPGGDFLGVTADFIMSPCSRSSLIIPGCQFGNFYLFVVGTSQAAPHVAGTGAMVDALYGGVLNGDEIMKIVEDTADDLGDREAYGRGRINVARAVSQQ